MVFCLPHSSPYKIQPLTGRVDAKFAVFAIGHFEIVRHVAKFRIYPINCPSKHPTRGNITKFRGWYSFAKFRQNSHFFAIFRLYFLIYCVEFREISHPPYWQAPPPQSGWKKVACFWTDFFLLVRNLGTCLTFLMFQVRMGTIYWRNNTFSYHSIFIVTPSNMAPVNLFSGALRMRNG
jgi:hypothetical protein